jgi:CubicO group peptidase (beta-lactamase class C family)
MSVVNNNPNWVVSASGTWWYTNDGYVYSTARDSAITGTVLKQKMAILIDELKTDTMEQKQNKILAQDAWDELKSILFPL